MSIKKSLRQIELLLASLLLAAVLGLMGWATITRVLGIPNIWVIEVTQVLFSWVCFMAGVIAFRKSQHFSVDLLSVSMPVKYRPWLTVLRNFLILLILIGLFWISLDYIVQSHRRKLPLTGIRFSWVTAALPTSCVLMATHCIECILDALKNINSKEL